VDSRLIFDGVHPPGSPRRLTLRARHRIANKLEFDRVFQAKARKHIGPLTIFVKPNGLPHFRYGVSVPRRVGGAVARNRIKRRLREAFRLHQHELPSAPNGGACDFVVTVRPHEVLEVSVYAAMLLEAARAMDSVWRRRAGNSKDDA
jgi:ribonuclease P protein component